jgi:aryl-alcohol dehydrogenase-like predicted oxidoreductase
MSLRRLDVERIDLYQLHRVDPATPMEESLGELRAMQGEGKIRHIGVSEVDVATVKAMREIVDVVSVQNLYNLTERRHEDVVDYCDQEGIGFIPWFPLATGALAEKGGPLARIVERHSATAPQLALAWLLRRSPVMLPIPGTSSVDHLSENCGAADVQLTDDEYADLASLRG